MRLAERRLGLFTREDARSAGVPARTFDRRVTSGRWVRVHPGVYRVEGGSRSREQGILAACLWGGVRAVASHRAAAFLWCFPKVSAADEITVERRLVRAGVTVHRQPLVETDRTRIGPIPVTSPARTLLDLGAVLPRAVPGSLDDALRRGLVRASQLRDALDAWAGSGVRGTAPLRAAFEQRAGVSGTAESLLEVGFLRAVRRSGLPEPKLQHPIRDLRGRRIARVDFAYPERRLAIEADGFRFHGGLADWRRDVERGNRLQEAGWTVLRVTWQDLEHPRELIRRLRRFLGASAAGSGA